MNRLGVENAADDAGDFSGRQAVSGGIEMHRIILGKVKQVVSAVKHFLQVDKQDTFALGDSLNGQLVLSVQAVKRRIAYSREVVCQRCDRG